MPVVTNGRVIYVAHPTGLMEPGVHTKYVEEQLDTDKVPLKDGEVLIQTIAFSSDPYMRGRMRDPSVPLFAPALVIGRAVDNFAVGKVVRSENKDLAAGDYVAGFLGFENYTVYPPPKEYMTFLHHCVKVPKVPGLPLSAYIGTLGLPGKTAYTGWSLYGQEKAKTSKTLFVSGGAGPVGTFVIQYAKITSPHLKIIASAGSDEKVEIMKKAGADVAINYKTQDVAKILQENGPIDIYWDNVAGPQLDAALNALNMFGVIIACGAISSLNEESKIKNFHSIFEKCITVHGFLFGFGDAAQKAIGEFEKEIPPLVGQGKITILEHKYNGLKSAEQALLEVHTGKNVGKAVIIVADE